MFHIHLYLGHGDRHLENDFAFRFGRWELSGLKELNEWVLLRAVGDDLGSMGSTLNVIKKFSG